jgi:hypothetical protein
LILTVEHSPPQGSLLRSSKLHLEAQLNSGRLLASHQELVPREQEEPGFFNQRLVLALVHMVKAESAGSIRKRMVPDRPLVKESHTGGRNAATRGAVDDYALNRRAGLRPEQGAAHERGNQRTQIQAKGAIFALHQPHSKR